MAILTWLTVFCSQLVFIGLRAFQQLNVVKGNYWAVVPTSVGMATVEVYVIASIARTGYSLPLLSAIALGGGLGCVLSMKVHRRWLTDRS